MKEKIIKSIVSAFEKGKLSKAMLKLKDDLEKKSGATLNAVAFATYIYDNEIHIDKSAVAGDEELANAYAYFSQEAMGGKEEGDDDPFWLNVWDADTRLNYGGKPVELNELSHIVNLDQWKENVEGHLKHNPNTKTELHNTDAKFDFENGALFLYMNPEDKDIHKGLREGVIKPSIEVGFPDYMYDDTTNKLKSYSKVKGLGLMADGKQMGVNVGPLVPNETALGGNEMAENEGGEPTEAEKFQTELKADMEKDPKTVVEKKDEYLKKIGDLKIEGEFKTAFELFLEKNKPEDEPPKSDEDKFKAEIKAMADQHQKEMEELKVLLTENKQKSEAKDEALAKIEADMIKVELENAKRAGISKKHILKRKDMTLDEVRQEIQLYRNVIEALNKGDPDEGVPPIIQQTKETYKDGRGNLTDDGYAALNSQLTPTKAKRFSQPLKGYNPYDTTK